MAQAVPSKAAASTVEPITTSSRSHGVQKDWHVDVLYHLNKDHKDGTWCLRVLKSEVETNTSMEWYLRHWNKLSRLLLFSVVPPFVGMAYRAVAKTRPYAALRRGIRRLVEYITAFQTESMLF